MKVEVEDTLPGVRANIGDEAVATFINAHVVRELRRGHEDPGEHRSVLECQIGHRGNMAAGNDQDVVWRLGIDVLKRYHVFILVDNFTGYLSGCDLAEQAVFHRTSFNYYSWGSLLSTAVVTATGSAGVSAAVATGVDSSAVGAVELVTPACSS